MNLRWRKLRNEYLKKGDIITVSKPRPNFAVAIKVEKACWGERAGGFHLQSHGFYRRVT